MTASPTAVSDAHDGKARQKGAKSRRAALRRRARGWRAAALVQLGRVMPLLVTLLS